MKPMRSILAAALVAVLASAAAAQKAPDFTLTDTGGKEHTLSQYQDDVVVLEWTNKDCPFVVRHYRDGAMQKLAAKYAEKGVVWLAIDSTKDAKPERIQKWRETSEVGHPVLMDTPGDVGRLYGAKTTPHMFVIAKGEIVYQGAIDDDARGQNEQPTNYVAQALDEVLAGKPVTTTSSKPYGCTVKYAPEKKGAKESAQLGTWIENFDEAKRISKATGKPILMDFTGSDWCGWCIRLKDEVFSQDEFKAWAKKNTVLLELDFPRKTEQDAELKKQNVALRDQFGIRGYPTIIFCDHSGKELGRTGYKKGGPEAWIAEAERILKP